MAQQHYHPSGRGPELIAVFTSFAIISTFTIAARVYVRVRLVKCFGVEDWSAVVGWLFFVTHCGFAIAGGFRGTGQHMNLIQPQSNVPIALKWWWTCEPLYVLCNMLIKLSIALMLLRLVLEPAHRWTLYVVTGLVQIYSVIFFFLFVFQCSPPSLFWTRTQGDTHGKCMDPNIIVVATYVYSGITCVVDWTLALLPWLLLKGLQMNKRTKVAVGTVLSLGSIASAATIVRIPYLSTLSNTDDFLYATTDVAIWSCVEAGLSSIASSAATLKPLFKNMLLRRAALRSTRSTRTRGRTPDVPLQPHIKGHRYERSYSTENASTGPKSYGVQVNSMDITRKVDWHVSRMQKGT